MPVHASTTALRDELRDPSVLSGQQFRAASRQFRPIIQRVSQQASVLQQLLVDVEEDETSPEVQAKLVAFDSALRSLQRRHDTAEKEYRQLAAALRQFRDLAQDLVQTIEAVDR